MFSLIAQAPIIKLQATVHYSSLTSTSASNSYTTILPLSAISGSRSPHTTSFHCTSNLSASHTVINVNLTIRMYFYIEWGGMGRPIPPPIRWPIPPPMGYQKLRLKNYMRSSAIFSILHPNCKKELNLRILRGIFSQLFFSVKKQKNCGFLKNSKQCMKSIHMYNSKTNTIEKLIITCVNEH